MQQSSMISLGSSFRPKSYENCTSMKLKWRGECDNEVKFRFERESKLRIETEFEDVKTIKQAVRLTEGEIILKNNTKTDTKTKTNTK